MRARRKRGNCCESCTHRSTTSHKLYSAENRRQRASVRGAMVQRQQVVELRRKLHEARTT